MAKPTQASCEDGSRGPSKACGSAHLIQYRQLKARFAAAKVVLETVSGTPRHGPMSSIQANALVDMVKKLELDPQEALDLAGLATEISFSNGDCDTVLESIAPKSICLARKKDRIVMQNYQTQSQYLTAELWDFLDDPDVSWHAKLDAFLEHAVVCGAHAPSEHSSKMWTSILLLAHIPKQDLMRMCVSEKVTYMNALKKRFQSIVKYSKSPTDYVVELPASPLDFKTLHPELFERAFAAGEPATCRVCIRALMQFDSSYNCRGGGSKNNPATLFGLGDLQGGLGALMQLAGWAGCNPTQMEQVGGGSSLLDRMGAGWRRNGQAPAERSLLDQMGTKPRKVARPPTRSFPPLVDGAATTQSAESANASQGDAETKSDVTAAPVSHKPGGNCAHIAAPKTPASLPEDMSEKAAIQSTVHQDTTAFLDMLQARDRQKNKRKSEEATPPKVQKEGQTEAMALMGKAMALMGKGEPSEEATPPKVPKEEQAGAMAHMVKAMALMGKGEPSEEATPPKVPKEEQTGAMALMRKAMALMGKGEPSEEVTPPKVPKKAKTKKAETTEFAKLPIAGDVDSDGLPHHCTRGKTKVAEPCLNHEKSRMQVLCRNGYKKSKSVPVKYGLGKKCATYAEALTMGARWLVHEKSLATRA